MGKTELEFCGESTFHLFIIEEPAWPLSPTLFEAVAPGP